MTILAIIVALALVALSAHLMLRALDDAERMQRTLDASYRRKLREDQERSER